MTSSFIIGFATQFYTLWSVIDEPYCNQYGEQIGVTHRYTYIKKIASTLERTRALFPDTPIDMNLCGHGSFNRFESFRPQYANDEFKFGKYAGKKVADCSDTSYLAYMWHQFDDDVRRIATPTMIAAGFHVIGDNLYNECEYARIMEHANFENIAKSGAAFDILFEKSLDEYGAYWHKGINIYFADYRTDSYNGWTYALPVINGRAKRIKNKMVHVSGYDYNADTKTITVKSFEILK